MYSLTFTISVFSTIAIGYGNVLLPILDIHSKLLPSVLNSKVTNQKIITKTLSPVVSKRVSPSKLTSSRVADSSVSSQVRPFPMSFQGF